MLAKEKALAIVKRLRDEKYQAFLAGGCVRDELLGKVPKDYDIATETQNIPILAATVLFREPDLKSCIEAGCNGYIVKPFTFQELQGKIQEYISDGESAVQ